LRTVASAIGGSVRGQWSRAEDLLTCVLWGDYFPILGHKWEHSPSTCTLPHTFPFDTSSVALVNTGKGIRVVNKPGSRRQSPVDLQGSQKPLGCLEHNLQVAAAQMSWAEIAVVPQ
jgi:hypothetical protein